MDSIYYKQLCFKYGFLFICFLIEAYEAIGKESECQAILDAMNELNSDYPLFDIPKKYSLDCIYPILKRITGRDSYEGLKYFYTDIIEKEIKNG